MNALSSPTPDTLELASGRILAALAPHAARGLMLETAARFAMHGPVRVLDGGNHFNAYLVARSIRRFTAGIDPVLDRISLARAFTCYQMEALLSAAALLVQNPATGEQQPATLVFDLLATFYDENVNLEERRRLLALCRRCLKAISARAPLLISLRPAMFDRPDQQELLDEMLGFADDIWEAQIPAAPAIPRLF